MGRKDEQKTAELILSLVKQEPSLNSVFNLLDRADWTFSVKHQKRGYCYWGTKQISIPAWTWDHGVEYILYYLAHEMAHALCTPADGHGPRFMQTFRRICPEHLQHFEIDYKASAAIAAGITAADF